MKKVLVVAYQFPPMGGSGVQRTVKFVKYMQEFGYRPVVLTRSEKRLPLRDDSLKRDIPQDVKVIHTGPWDPTTLPGILKYAGKLAGKKLLIPDAERLWQVMSVKLAARIVPEEAIDLVYTTSYPYSDHLLGLALKKKYPRMPWVADFRDEWTRNPYFLDNHHFGFRLKMERAMEKAVLLGADMLITNTPVMLKNFLDMEPSLKDRFYVIPNGYDKEDFTGLDSNDVRDARTIGAHPPVCATGDKRFTITYTGLLYGRRKPDLFFEAVSGLLKEGKLHPGKIRIRLIGNYKRHLLLDTVSKYGLQDIVAVMPYMEHRECLRMLADSDALLLLEGPGPGSEAFYTGKVFEYMNTGRPILAVIPANGAAAGLVRETRTGAVADCSDLAAIKTAVCAYYDKWLTGNIDYDPDMKEVSKYERKALTAELAEIFNKACRAR